MRKSSEKTAMSAPAAVASSEALGRQSFVGLDGAHGGVGLHRSNDETLDHARLLEGFKRRVSLLGYSSRCTRSRRS